MSRTKIAGWLLVIAATAKMIADVFDGGSFSIMQHFDSVSMALSGAGFVFLRDAIKKIEGK